MTDLLPHLWAFLASSKYILLFAGSYIEGTVVMLTGGVLVRLGQVEFWPTYVALLAGDFLADIMWYFIGYFGARKAVLRWGHLADLTPAVLEKIEKRFHTYHTWVLVISKLTMGFGLAAGTLMVAGMMRISFLRFCVINFLGGVVWVYLVLTVGYYFGNVFQYIPKQFQIAFVVVVLIAAFAALRFVTKRLAKMGW